METDQFGNPVLTDYTSTPTAGFSNMFSAPQLPQNFNTGVNPAMLNTTAPSSFSGSFSSPDYANSWGNYTGSNEFSNYVPDTSVTTENAEGGIFSNFFNNSKGGAGWGVQALGAAQGIAQGYLGFQQLKEGKKQNDISNNQWQAQFDIQKTEYDRKVSERNARIASAKAARQNTGGA